MFSIKQKITFLLSIIMLFNFLVITAQPPVAPPTGYHWQLMWEDNFDGTTLDPLKWTTNYHWGATDALGGEVRGDNYIHPSSVNVKDGILRLTDSENLFPANYPASNNGEYRLMNKANYKFITPLNASTTAGTQITQVAYGSITDWNASQWKLVSQSDNSYLIRNIKSNLYLKNTANTISQAALTIGDTNYKWILTPIANGWYSIQNVGSQLYLSQDGTYVTEAAYDASNTVQWKLFCKLQWISGVVQNYNKIHINRPGYVEASLKMPASTGTWPAFWLMKPGWPPEVDILEYLSTAPSVVHNVHYKDASGVNKSSVKGDQTKVNPRDYDSRFRTFGFYMGASTFGALNEFHWYIDNVWNHGWWSSEFYAQFNDMYAIFSHGNGGWAGYPDANSTFPNNYDIDWFRYWELVPGCANPVVTPYSRINGGQWSTATTLNINSGAKVDLGPQPLDGTWSWSGCNAPIGNPREITIYPTNSCVITATNTNSCGGSTTVNFTIIVDGVPLSVQNFKDKEFTIYPNPANNTLNIQLPEIYKNNSLVTISNSLGQIISSKNNTNENEQTLDISNLSSGVYFIKITNNEASTTKKFIKQ